MDVDGGGESVCVLALGLLGALAASACGTPAPCPSGTTECDDGTCAILTTDQDHCGACGNVCAGGEVCDGAGQCALECLPSLTLCDGICTDPLSSRDFCGAGPDCTGGAVCATGEICAGGGCAESCPSGFVLCDGRCIDPLVSLSFCGAVGICVDADAGVACQPGEVCTNGECALECQPGQVICGGQCTDPLVSRAFCGATGSCEGAESGEACAPGSICAAGRCGPTCPPGRIVCGGRCTDPLTDNAFCGAEGDCQAEAAGVTCGPGTICSGGSCGLTCLPGSIECGGRCVDTSVDRAYCGATGDCVGENIGAECTAGQVCVDGVCALSCPEGQIECDGQCVDPATDVLYCGASGDCLADDAGAECPPGNTCTNRRCVPTCQAELVSCGGACVDPMDDRTYCGASANCAGSNAGSTCQADETCQEGTCEPQPCPGGLLACGVFCVDPDSDPLFCGASGACDGDDAGTPCARRQACIDGVCSNVSVAGAIGSIVSASSTGSYSGAGVRSTRTRVGRTNGNNNAYLSFSLAGVSGEQVVAAYLRVTVEDYRSPDDEETVSVWDVTTSSSQLDQMSGSRPAIFTDLGDGFRYGAAVVERTDLGATIEIDLRGAAFQDLLDAFGDTFSVGLRHNTPGSGRADEVLELDDVELSVAYVPDP